MSFLLKQLVKTYQVLPFYYRLPGVKWRVLPIAVVLTYRYLSGALRFFWRCWREPAPRHEGDDKLTVVVLSFDRIANIEPLVKPYLRLPFVERVVITNNNPAYRLADWISLEDPRLVLLDQAEKTKPGVRFEVARDYPSRFYFSVDDDIFLTPRQLETLFHQLVARPECLHGLYGQRYVGPAQTPQHLHGWDNNWTGQETEVDVINRIYAFTSDHLERYFRHLEVLGVQSSRQIGNGEDVVLCSTGQGRPRIHDVGEWFDCISDHDPRVALHLALPDFAAERAEIYLKLREHVERQEQPIQRAG